MNCTSPDAARFELRFVSLFDAHRAYAFPCNEAGQVDINVLSDRARINYFYARTVVGREFHCPSVEASVH